MEKSTKTCLAGCGIGCGLLLFLVIAGMVIVGSQMSKLTEGFEESIELNAALDREYPDAEEYTPAADGAITAERMELFLEIRQALAPHREELQAKLQSLEMTDAELNEMEEGSTRESLGKAWDMMRGAMSLPSSMAAFERSRNETLLTSGMGMGEYSYIFWSAHEAGGRILPKASDTPVTIQSSIGSKTGRRGREQWRGMVFRQAEVRAVEVEGADNDPWLSVLRAEVARLEEEPRSAPWADGLPIQISVYVDPFRERLDALYDAGAHDLELMRSRKSGPGSFTID